MLNRNNLSFFFILLFSASLFAQIGGLSASKLAALNTETVPQFTIEFEPSFNFGYAKNRWNIYGHVEPMFKKNDSLETHSEMDFRFTYGITSKWEMGFSLPSDASYLSFGSKFRFWEMKNISLALLNGFNLLLGNHRYCTKYAQNNSTSYAINPLLGLAISYRFSRRFSVDINPVFQSHFDPNAAHFGRHLDSFINADFGYYLWPKFQTILGIYYFTMNTPSRSHKQKLSLNPGFTLEKAKHFILVLNFPVDIWGINSDRQAGCGFALTIWIN